MNENKTSLYGLTVQYQELYSRLLESADEDGAVDIEISQALAVKEEEFTEKAVAVASVYRKFDNEIALYEQEIKRLQAYKTRLEKCRDKLKDNLSTACQVVGVTKIDGMYANISFRSSEKTVVDDESLLPEEYFNVTITRKPNLTKIKEDIRKGIDVQGAHVVSKNNINIK